MNAPPICFSRDIYQTIGATLLVTTGVSYLYKSFFASTNSKSPQYSKLAKTKLSSQYTQSLNIDAAEPKLSSYVSCQFHYRGYHIKAIGIRSRFRKGKFLKEELCCIILQLLQNNTQVTLNNILKHSNYSIDDLYISMIYKLDTIVENKVYLKPIYDVSVANMINKASLTFDELDTMTDEQLDQLSEYYVNKNSNNGSTNGNNSKSIIGEFLDMDDNEADSKMVECDENDDSNLELELETEYDFSQFDEKYSYANFDEWYNMESKDDENDESKKMSEKHKYARKHKKRRHSSKSSKHCHRRSNSEAAIDDVNYYHSSDIDTTSEIGSDITDISSSSVSSLLSLVSDSPFDADNGMPLNISFGFDFDNNMNYALPQSQTALLPLSSPVKSKGSANSHYNDYSSYNIGSPKSTMNTSNNGNGNVNSSYNNGSLLVSRKDRKEHILSINSKKSMKYVPNFKAFESSCLEFGNDNCNNLGLLQADLNEPVTSQNLLLKRCNSNAIETNEVFCNIDEK